MKLRALALAVLLASCAPLPSAAPTPAACGDTPSSGDPRTDVLALAERCASGMSRVRGEASGTQGESDPSARLALEVRGARSCFRVLAAGDAGVTELDVQITDSGGRPVSRDARRGRLAVVPEDGLLCLPKGETYLVEIAVTGGRGAFVAQVFSAR